MGGELGVATGIIDRAEGLMRNREHRTGFTLVELLVVIVILGILMALLLPAIASAIKNAKITSCSSNMSQLTKAMYNYSITKMENEGSFPQDLGGNFWEVLYTMNEVEEPKALWCPVAGSNLVAGDTDFMGPDTNVNLLGGHEAIGADDHPNKDLHGHAGDPDVGYCWVAKTGDVHKTPKSSPKWTSLLATLQP